MRGIKELTQADPSTLTPEELKYLNKYKELKKFKHSTSFVYHSRKLPEEANGNSN